jgi:hydrogenase maturation protease
MQTECLIQGRAPTLNVSVRFLQYVTPSDSQATPDPSGTWQEAIERVIDLSGVQVSALLKQPISRDVNYSAQLLNDGDRPRTQQALDVNITLSVTNLADDLWKLRVAIQNTTPLEAAELPRAQAGLRATISTHTLLACEAGAFVSLLEPSPELQVHAESCRNVGSWPVLVGGVGSASTMLSSPIILYDNPGLAAQSAGDLFDATEIDEILTLRILTLTPDERAEAMRCDPRARALLERTEALNEEQLLALHGMWREPERSPSTRKLDLAPGDRVRLRPGPNGDVFDLALANEPATIASIEEDFEGRIHYAVTIDADPGRDLGLTGQPGHRFFFSREELERLP